MLNKQYRSKFETTTFKIPAGGRISLINPPGDHPQFSNGLSACTSSDHTLTALEAANYKKSVYFRIPNIILTKHGTLIEAFDIRWDSDGDIGQRICIDQCTGISRSTDNGKTWSDPQVTTAWLYSEEYYDEASETNLVKYQSGASDPGLLYDEDNDCIFMFSTCGYGLISGKAPDKNAEKGSAFRGQTSMTYSFDDGLTWSLPESLLKYIDDDNFNSKVKGKYGFLFPGCSAGVKLRHLKNESNNGTYVFPIQLWTAISETGNSRSALLQLIPSYTTEDGKKVARFSSARILDGMTGAGARANTGSSECAVCEDNSGNLVMVIKSYWRSDHANIINPAKTDVTYLKVYKSENCGETWDIMADTFSTTPTGKEKETTGKVCATILDALGCKPSICYCPYNGTYYINYQLGIDRRMSVIRSSTDLIHWQLFDVISYKSSIYGSLLALNNKRKIALVLEGTGKSAAREFKYVEYDLTAGNNLVHSNSTNNVITNTVGSQIFNYKIQGFDFYINAVTDKKNVKMRKLGYEMSDDDINKTQCIAIFTKEDDEYSLYAVSKPVTLNSGDILNQAWYRKVMFEFENTIVLQRDVRYYVSICNNDTAIVNPAEYDTSTVWSTMTVCDAKCESDQEVRINYKNNPDTDTSTQIVPNGLYSGNKLQPMIFIEEDPTDSKFMTYTGRKQKPVDQRTDTVVTYTAASGIAPKTITKVGTLTQSDILND